VLSNYPYAKQAPAKNSHTLKGEFFDPLSRQKREKDILLNG
jgi:hypothetical protein